MRDPGRLVPLTAIGNGGEVWGVRLDEKPVFRHEREEMVISPFLERDNSAEGDVPAGRERFVRERVRSRVTVKHALHTGGSSLTDHRAGVVLGVAGVNDERTIELVSQGQLRGERRALAVARRVVIVVVEAALADGNRTTGDELFNAWNVTPGVERGRVVRMYSGGVENEARMGAGDPRSTGGRFERLADADDSLRARFAGASDYRVAVAFEGRVREVGVAVDEDCLPSVRRGHFRSIHRRIGAAT